MIDQRRMTPSERERDLRRRNINPHAPCAPGFDMEAMGGVILTTWIRDGFGYIRLLFQDVLGVDDWGALLAPARCSKGSIHMPDCDTGEEMSFAEWLRRDAERAWQRAWQLRRRRLMQIMGES